MGDLLNYVTTFLQSYGYLASDCRPKSFKDIELTAAVARFQRFDANVGQQLAETGQPLLADGQVGPATLAAMAQPRCACADDDTELPALGAGGWSECHGAQGFHQAIVQVHPENMPAFLQPVLPAVLANVQKSYADLGLLFRFVSADLVDLLTGEKITGRVNIDMEFTRGDGWIGLAIVGNGSNQKCSAKIWARFDYRYQPGDVLREWTTLVKHELGHNCGLRHTSGGVMNPSIVRGLSVSWQGDPSHATLVRWFGGQPVKIPGPDPGPGPQPPDGDWPKVGQPISPPFLLPNGTRAQLYRVLGG